MRDLEIKKSWESEARRLAIKAQGVKRYKRDGTTIPLFVRKRKRLTLTSD
jgi:hypothetical protein